MNKSIDNQKKSKWNDDVILIELQNIIHILNHFPSSRELVTMNKNGLLTAIKKHGYINKFRKLLAFDPIKKPNGYWSDENIIKELKTVINKIGHFPQKNELLSIKKTNLLGAIGQHEGSNKFRKLMGYDFIQKPEGYWTEENTINGLETIIDKIGHFPTYPEIEQLDSSLPHGIHKNGGLDSLRIKMGYSYRRQPIGYWTDEVIIQRIKTIIGDIGHFPSYNELQAIDGKISSAIDRSKKSMSDFRKICGYATPLYDKYRYELRTYSDRRGRKSELIVRQMLLNYCSIHNIPNPHYNEKLSKGHVIEFVCDIGKRIGIDVTNTKCSQNCVTKKWTRKSYHKHLDELWIVVFSNTFKESDYIRWNRNSPPNVKVMSVYQFLEELDYSLDEHTKNKIDKYNSCTFHTKEELKGRKEPIQQSLFRIARNPKTLTIHTSPALLLPLQPSVP